MINGPPSTEYSGEVLPANLFERPYGEMRAAEVLERMGRGDGDHACARGQACLDTDVSILEDDAVRRLPPDAPGALQENFRIRLAMADVLAGDDRLEAVAQPDRIDHRLDVPAMRRRGDCAWDSVLGECAQQLRHAGERPDALLQDDLPVQLFLAQRILFDLVQILRPAKYLGNDALVLHAEAA